MLRRLILFSAVFFTALVSAEFKGWEPVAFIFGEEPGRAAIEELRARKDVALAHVVKSDPSFSQEFPVALARFASMALQSITSPWTVGEDSVITQKGLSYVIGKTVKNLQIFALNNAGQIAAKNLDSTQASELTYRYCEIHPADNDWCYYTNEYNSIDWAILRRVVSSAQFVKAACPVIKTYAAWDLQWKIKDEKVRLEVEKFIEEFYRMLDFIYADGTWTLSRIDSYKGDFDPGFFRTLVRRYMDGGPEFIEELKNCTNEFMNEYNLGQPLPEDAKATAAINEILSFGDVVLNGQNRSLSFVDFDFWVYYRLSHRLGMGQRVPADLFMSGENSFPYDEYLSTLTRPEVNAYKLHHLLWQLSALDPQFSYRTINRQEFNALFKGGFFPHGFEVVCIVEGTGLNRKFYSGNPDGMVTDEVWSCPLNTTKIVRESK